MSNGGGDQSPDPAALAMIRSLESEVRALTKQADYQNGVLRGAALAPDWRPWHTCEGDAAHNDEWDDVLSLPDHAMDDPTWVAQRYGLELEEVLSRRAHFQNDCHHLDHPGIPEAPGGAERHWPGAMQGGTLWSRAYHCGFCAENALDQAMPKPTHYTASDAPSWLRELLQLSWMLSAERLSPAYRHGEAVAAYLSRQRDSEWPAHPPPDLDATSPTGPARLTACLAIAPAAPPVCADLALAA